MMIKLQYRIKQGRKLDLKNPRRYTERLQWYKLNYRDPLMSKCADKLSVREYIESKGLKDILIPLYGVYNSPDKIDFDSLPEQYVLKITNGCQTNVIVKSKSEIDTNHIKQSFNQWMKQSVKSGREWAYYDIKPRIICEKYIASETQNDLPDYKFFCFQGEIYCLYVICNRFSNEGPQLGIFDVQFQQLPYFRGDENPMEMPVEQPENFDRMIEIAKILSEDFPHVRVDLYNVDGQIYFGELTFYDGSGYQPYEPDEFDYILGSKFNLPEKV